MKSGSYSALVRSTSLSQKTKIATPRGNYTSLLNRGGVQYDPTGTAHSIGELGQRKNKLLLPQAKTGHLSSLIALCRLSPGRASTAVGLCPKFLRRCSCIFLEHMAEIGSVFKSNMVCHLKYFQMSFFKQLAGILDFFTCDRVHDGLSCFLTEKPAEIMSGRTLMADSMPKAVGCWRRSVRGWQSTATASTVAAVQTFQSRTGAGTQKRMVTSMRIFWTTLSVRWL